MKSKYTIGECLSCQKNTALKDGYCQDCQSKIELPNFFKDLFSKGESNGKGI
jgi:hypothetical protein